MCVLDIHWREYVSQTTILVIYNGIHAEMEKRELGSGVSAPRKSFAKQALSIAGKYLSSFVTLRSFLSAAASI